MSNKNQHFVSQTYLRGFGIPGEGETRAINLFAIGAGKVVEAASIRQQCSSNYFYGQNEAVENLLQLFESRYGSAMANLKRGAIRRDQLETLVQFTFLQSLRTSSQLKERLRLIEEWGKLEIAGKRVRDNLPAPDKAREIQH